MILIKGDEINYIIIIYRNNVYKIKWMEKLAGVYPFMFSINISFNAQQPVALVVYFHTHTHTQSYHPDVHGLDYF